MHDGGGVKNAANTLVVREILLVNFVLKDTNAVELMISNCMSRYLFGSTNVSIERKD